MMYESPIKIIEKKINEYLEDGMMKAVYKADFLVDKEELYKALRYDRDQYARGYADRDHEIVRCRDCKFCKKYYHGAESNLGMFTYECIRRLYTVTADEFCSKAERKEE